MKQSDAVYVAVCRVIGDGFDGKAELNDAQKSEVIKLVTAGILAGQVDFSTEARAKYDTEAKVKSYTSGMVSNHLRKDRRLNGGVKYETKNPGSRAGVGDAALKAMKLLRSTLTDAEEIAEVEAAIEARISEIKASKVKVVEINVNAIPEHLRHLVK